MKSFEIQTYKDSNWRIDSIFDNRDLALFEARRVEEGNRYSGIRVIEENYDEASNQATSRTIFRGGKNFPDGAVDQKEKARKVALAKKWGRDVRHGSRAPGRKRRRQKKAKTSKFIIPVLVLGVLVIVGLAALFGLRHLLQFL